MFKADGSFLVHDDAGGYRPLNWVRKEFRPTEREVPRG
jgi:RecB family endonuclease NucS